MNKKEQNPKHIKRLDELFELKKPLSTKENKSVIKQNTTAKGFSKTYGKGVNKHKPPSYYSSKTLPKTGKNLILRSPEVHEILSYIPNWIIRWGNTLVLLILLGILVMSYFIKYPDVVIGNITLTSIQPPVPIIAKVSAPIKLLVEDKANVSMDEVIGILKNDANYADILLLKEELADFQQKLQDNWKFTYYELPKGLQLGELQSAYSMFFLKLREHQIQQGFATKNTIRKGNLDKQLQELHTIQKAKEKSLSIKYQEYLKAKNLLITRYKILFDKGSISKEQLNVRESEVNILLESYQNDRIAFNEIKKRILDLSNNKTELDFQKEDQLIRSQSELLNALDNLRNHLYSWEQTYLLKSPIDGRLNYIKFSTDNMYVQQEQTIANIIPQYTLSNLDQDIRGKLLIPVIGSGKVAKEQLVIISLHDFPKKEFGNIEGVVTDISNIVMLPTDNQGVATYKVMVDFPNGLLSTTKKQLPFKHNMQGRAEIITEDIRLIERFFHELRAIK